MRGCTCLNYIDEINNLEASPTFSRTYPHHRPEPDTPPGKKSPSTCYSISRYIEQKSQIVCVDQSD
jgi:hypothetical protein